MATRGENCNDWPRTVMTGGCLLVAFALDGATGNDFDLIDVLSLWVTIQKVHKKYARYANVLK